MISWDENVQKVERPISTPPRETKRRNSVIPNTTYKQEINNLVEVRKPTMEEMKTYFLALLRDQDIIDTIRRFIPSK